jgi:hypothetical protein
MKNIKFLVIIIAALMVFIITSAKPASAATRLSGISIQSACEFQYGKSVGDTTMRAMLYGKTVINWLCVLGVKSSYGSTLIYKYSVDLNRECRRIYGSSAYAAYTSYYNPYSWGCYR